jgi:hypothetical protein
MVMQRLLPPDAGHYVGFIAGILAEHARNPEVVSAYRVAILLPRREVVRQVVARGQLRGDLRRDVDAETLVDMLGGQFLARAFAGLNVGTTWQTQAFDARWTLVRAC